MTLLRRLLLVSSLLASSALHPPPVLAQTQAAQPPATLRVVYTNDSHEHWEGLARTITGVQALSQEAAGQGQAVLKLHGGDYNTGGETEDVDLSLQLLQRLGLNAAAMGNHELDLAPATLATLLARWANFPTLVSNLTIPAASPLKPRLSGAPQVVQTPVGPVGLLGVSRPAETGKIRDALQREGYTALSFEATCQQVQAQVQQLAAQGVRQIILLSHMGLDLDRQLAQQVRGVDIIVGGDSHHALHGLNPGQNVFQDPVTGAPTVIVQAGANGDWVGALDVAFDSQGRVLPAQNRLVDTHQFAPDPAAESLLIKQLPPKQTVMTLATRYDNAGIHRGPDALAQLAADALRVPGVDISLIRSREIRESLPAGPVSNWDLKPVMPYSDPVVWVRLTGVELAGALQRAAMGVAVRTPKPAPLLHPSGLRYSLDPKTGALGPVWVQKGSSWVPLNPFASYTVALGGYAVHNPQEFPELAHPERVLYNTRRSVIDHVMAALRARSGQQGAVTLPAPDGRLNIQALPSDTAQGRAPLAPGTVAPAP